jgi:predicted RNA-binding Zn-ribbon protein involved in translation (DUF1610 family)
MKKDLDPHPNALILTDDWAGNNAAFTCPVDGCGQVFIVSEAKNIHNGERPCPKCGKSIGRVKGGRKSGGTASISW